MEHLRRKRYTNSVRGRLTKEIWSRRKKEALRGAASEADECKDHFRLFDRKDDSLPAEAGSKFPDSLALEEALNRKVQDFEIAQGTASIYMENGVERIGGLDLK